MRCSEPGGSVGGEESKISGFEISKGDRLKRERQRDWEAVHLDNNSIASVTSGQKINKKLTTQQNVKRMCNAAFSSKRSIHAGRKQAHKQIRKQTPMQEYISSRKTNRTTRIPPSDSCESRGSRWMRSHLQPSPRRKHPISRTPRSLALLSKFSWFSDCAIALCLFHLAELFACRNRGMGRNMGPYDRRVRGKNFRMCGVRLRPLDEA